MKAFHLTKIIIASTILVSSAQVSIADSENDPMILASVSKIISSNPNLSNVGAKVRDGDIILTGTVNNIDDATNLVCRAAQIRGVDDISTSGLKSMDDQLSVTKDAGITTKIKAKIGSSAPGVSVSTNAGGVLLVGSVNSVKKANEIKKNASKVEGVKCVVSHLTVKQ